MANGLRNCRHSLNPHEQHELIQDWAIGVEVEEDVANNPINQAIARLRFGAGSLSGEMERK